MPTPRKGFKLLENVAVIGWHSSGKAIVTDGRHNIYVTRTIPGEIVNIEVAKRQKRNYIAGNITEIVQPSPYRINPQCPHFELCGGCNWMHVQYEHQLAFKKILIEQALEKYQIPHPQIADVVPSPQTTAYRGKVEFAFTRSEDKICIGFHPLENPHHVFPLEACMITQHEVINIAQKIAETINLFNIPVVSPNNSGILKAITVRCNRKGDQLLIFHLEQNYPKIQEVINYLIGKFPSLQSVYLKIGTHEENNYIHTWGSSHLIEWSNGLQFQLSADAFYQPNIYLAEQLFKEIVNLASPTPNDIVYDLYTGVGTIALHIAPYAKRVIGIENSASAIQDARQNSLLNHTDNVEFIAGDVLKTFTPDFIEQHGKPDIVVLDPPRSGTLIETLKNILAFGPRRIVYVSCNPVSLAWNLTFLKNEYTIEKIIPFDMFPQTHHVETLVLLHKIR